jgi:HSP90 family molecular chaperone
MSDELKYVNNCWYCNEIMKALNKKADFYKYSLLSHMFRITDIVKLVDGEDKAFPKKMSRKTAFKHIKELIKAEYLEDGYHNLKIAYGRLGETINSTSPFLEVLKFKDQTIFQMADFIDNMHVKYLTIGLRAFIGKVNELPKTSTS